MPTPHQTLGHIPQRLGNSLWIGVFGEAVAKIILSSNFFDPDFAPGHLILEP